MRVVVKFYLGQNKDYRLGNSISDSSEELLQIGKGMARIYVVLVKGEYMQANHIFFLQKVSASLEEQMSPRRILVLFQIQGNARIRLIKSSPKNSLNTCSASFSQNPVYLIPDLHFELFSGVLKVSSCRGSEFDSHRGRWQVPVCR